MRRFIWPRDQLGERLEAGEPLLLADPSALRRKVPQPPFIPSHSSAALEAQAHVLVERAAAFAAPALIAAEYRPHFAPVPCLLGVHPW